MAERSAGLRALLLSVVAPATLSLVIAKPNRIHENGLCRFARFGGNVRMMAEPKYLLRVPVFGHRYVTMLIPHILRFCTLCQL
jgi:hypothetical protein